MIILYADVEQNLIGLHAPLLSVEQRDAIMSPCTWLEYSDGITWYEWHAFTFPANCRLEFVRVNQEWQIERV